MPRVISARHREAFARQLATYVAEQGLTRCLVLLHGGEPLLAGTETLVQFAKDIRGAVDSKTQVDFGIQTNGLLLTEGALDALEAANISVSLSLDGPREANDRHRVSRRGRRSSFDGALAALERLLLRPAIFSGVIAVIDPATRPETLFEFFERYRPPKLDFLLPDANYAAPPPERDQQPDLYKAWLIEAFDLWFDRYGHIPVRLFEVLLDALAGLPAHTDAFGLADISLLTIETDGTYHDLDVLKVTAEGLTQLGGSVLDTSIAQAAASERIEAHRRLLRRDGLCADCQACPEVEVCGGGSVPHRFSTNGNFNNPTVYCSEMLALIRHVRQRLRKALQDATPPPALVQCPSFDLEAFEVAEHAGPVMAELLRYAHRDRLAELDEAVNLLSQSSAADGGSDGSRTVLDKEQRDGLAMRPGVIAWQSVVRRLAKHGAVFAVDGTPLALDTNYVSRLAKRRSVDAGRLSLGEDDPWLRLPFGASIIFEPPSALAQCTRLTEEALAIIDRWRPAVSNELMAACRAVQFIRDPSAHPDKIVSFSDNSVPGALYVSVRKSTEWIDPYDLADSLLHEHRHQKLYLLERLIPLVEPTSMTVASPWREDPRPPSGLMHAVFVFIELRRFWLSVLADGPAGLQSRAKSQIAETNARLAEGITTLRKCPLTRAGGELLEILDRASQSQVMHLHK